MPHVLPEFMKTDASAGGFCAHWPGFGAYNFEPSVGFEQQVVRLQAQDGAWSRAILYTHGNEKTVVCFCHPKGDFSSHYSLPKLTAAGYAVLGQQSRYFNHDTACIHEHLVADVGAAVRFLKNNKKFQNIVLIGNSGGGSLYSLYQAQASATPPGRVQETAAGDKFDLNAFELPQADALVLLAAHLGEGEYLMSVIDPSVTDEDDPLSCDPSLDMYNPANGFRPLPEESRYSEEFLVRYRTAQRARVARLDAIARQRISERRYYQNLEREPAFGKKSLEEQQLISRRASVGKYLTIYRTDANPACVDLSIQPSARTIGSLLSPRPDLNNYKLGGFAGCMTPEAWLSTWSALASHGAVLQNIAKVEAPTLIVNYSGDTVVFPDQAQAILDACGATDKTLRTINSDHYGAKPDGTMAGRDEATDVMIAWLRERFPAR